MHIAEQAARLAGQLVRFKSLADSVFQSMRGLDILQPLIDDEVQDRERQHFLFLNVKTVMFFLCTAEHYSIINSVLLHKFKGYNKENGKLDESLGRKARRG